MNNCYYHMEPVKNSVVNMKNWKVLNNNYGEILAPYLVSAQEILEIEMGHLFQPRWVEFQWVFKEKIVQLPIKFIKQIEEIRYKNNQYFTDLPREKVKILDCNTLEIQFNQINTPMMIKYVAKPMINESIQWKIIAKAIDLLYLSLKNKI